MAVIAWQRSQSRFSLGAFKLLAVHQAYYVVELIIIEQQRRTYSFAGGAHGVKRSEKAKIQHDKSHRVNTPPDGGVNIVYLSGRGV